MAEPLRCIPQLEDASTQIRLLRFEHTASIADIHCELSIHDIEDVDQKFIAISYTWGPEYQKVRIYVNGHPVWVRWNCWEALRQVRGRRHGFTEDCAYDIASDMMFYWIDSICINQDVHAEKNLQVARMSAIFSKALSVAVCVGDTGPDRSLFAHGKCADMDPSHLRRLSDDPDGPICSFALEVRGDFSKSRQAPVRNLAKRAYFERLWTVQECIMAKTIEIHCGEGVNTWTRLLEYINDLEGQSTNPSRKILDVLGLDDDREMFEEASGTSSLSLHHCIIRYSRRQCSDLRDKVYGLLSLASPWVRERIEPDYQKSLLESILDVATLYPKLGLGGIQYEQDVWETQKGSLGYVLKSLAILADQFSTSQEFSDDLHSIFDNEASHGSLMRLSALGDTSIVTIEVYGTYYQPAESEPFMDAQSAHDSNDFALQPECPASESLNEKSRPSQHQGPAQSSSTPNSIFSVRFAAVDDYLNRVNATIHLASKEQAETPQTISISSLFFYQNECPIAGRFFGKLQLRPERLVALAISQDNYLPCFTASWPEQPMLEIISLQKISGPATKPQDKFEVPPPIDDIGFGLQRELDDMILGQPRHSTEAWVLDCHGTFAGLL